ncbi:hypothetical protein, partial [Klebsiella aerogenes]|uniref:hypothetical protein n=1 Tax=Klebsiella aerogenes TaxID=548 RepID=UPI001BCE7D4B
LRHGKHIAEKSKGSAISSEATLDKRFSQAKKLQTDSSIYEPLTAIPGAGEAQRKPWKGRYFFGRYFSGSSGTGRLSSIR